MALPISLLIILGPGIVVAETFAGSSVLSTTIALHPGFPGESIPVKIEIENRKFLPLTWLRTVDPWPKAVGPEGRGCPCPEFLSGPGFL